MKKTAIGIAVIVIIIASAAIYQQNQRSQDKTNIRKYGWNEPPNNSAQIRYVINTIIKTAKNGIKMEEITDPGFALPTSIEKAQVNKYFQMGDYYFALVLRPSMNLPLLDLPSGYEYKFCGILIAKKGGLIKNGSEAWQQFASIRDTNVKQITENYGNSSTSTGSGLIRIKEFGIDKNNPYFLRIKEGKIMLSVVDQNGAGSGEGILKPFELGENGEWNLKGCYYFTGDALGRDYFGSTAFPEKFPSEPISSCVDKVVLKTNLNL